MTVGIYNYKDGIHDIVVRDDEVVVKAKASKSYQSGEYVNERNITLDISLTPEQVLEAAEEIKNND